MCVAVACLARVCVYFPQGGGGKKHKTESSNLHKEIFASSDTQLHILNNFFIIRILLFKMPLKLAAYPLLRRWTLQQAFSF